MSIPIVLDAGQLPAEALASFQQTFALRLAPDACSELLLAICSHMTIPPAEFRMSLLLRYGLSVDGIGNLKRAEDLLVELRHLNDGVIDDDEGDSGEGADAAAAAGRDGDSGEADTAQSADDDDSPISGLALPQLRVAMPDDATAKTFANVLLNVYEQVEFDHHLQRHRVAKLPDPSSLLGTNIGGFDPAALTSSLTTAMLHSAQSATTDNFQTMHARIGDVAGPECRVLLSALTDPLRAGAVPKPMLPEHESCERHVSVASHFLCSSRLPGHATRSLSVRRFEDFPYNAIKSPSGACLVKDLTKIDESNKTLVLHSFLQFTDALEAVAIDSDLPHSYKTAATTLGEKLSRGEEYASWRLRLHRATAKMSVRQIIEFFKKAQNQISHHVENANRKASGGFDDFLWPKLDAFLSSAEAVQTFTFADVETSVSKTAEASTSAARAAAAAAPPQEPKERDPNRPRISPPSAKPTGGYPSKRKARAAGRAAGDPSRAGVPPQHRSAMPPQPPASAPYFYQHYGYPQPPPYPPPQFPQPPRAPPAVAPGAPPAGGGPAPRAMPKCIDHLKGHCRWGAACKFDHTP